MNVDTSPILGYDYQAVDMIVTFADGHNLPPVLLLASGLQESQLNIWEGTGDGGLSFGVFQIYTSVHGGPGSLWQGYDGLARSMQRMGVDVFLDGLPRWQWAFTKFGGWGRWLDDAVNMVQDMADDMQGSIEWTFGQAHLQTSRAMAIYSLYQNRQIAALEAALASAPPSNPEPAPDRTRELIDAITVSARDWREAASASGQSQSAALLRADHLDGIINSFR